ncbi:Caspase recruitment domain-containing protein 8 [Pteropus alecto]|uniref:Caspase recruitment domain-containing protein 8 n=1 Tax=Pteropus alecto TaxID=9402 RepID=L5L582_PTEAL|nr:Caspase recruitment domain-containing protein 8 [Pteropus alecto]
MASVGSSSEAFAYSLVVSVNSFCSRSDFCAIDGEEASFHGVRLQSSAPVEALNFGSRYTASCTANVDIAPKEFKLSYRNPGEIQPFSKAYAGKMKKLIRFKITEKRHQTLSLGDFGEASPVNKLWLGFAGKSQKSISVNVQTAMK